MGIIYQPKGKAREYCGLAANLYAGCTHGCTYCYVPVIKSRFSPENVGVVRKMFHRAAAPRRDVVERLEKEAAKYAGCEVLFSFTSDPYQKADERLELTRCAMTALHKNNVRVNVLTKGGSRAERDFDILAANGGKFGTTLTFLSLKHSLFYERGAAFPNDRIEAIRKAKKKGIYTWVSLEPVIDPAQTIELVKATSGFVDMYKVGRWNYDPMSEYIDWRKFLDDIVGVFEAGGLKYFIKEGLRDSAEGVKSYENHKAKLSLHL